MGIGGVMATTENQHIGTLLQQLVPHRTGRNSGRDNAPRMTVLLYHQQ